MAESMYRDPSSYCGNCYTTLTYSYDERYSRFIVSCRGCDGALKRIIYDAEIRHYMLEAERHAFLKRAGVPEDQWDDVRWREMPVVPFNPYC